MSRKRFAFAGFFLQRKDFNALEKSTHKPVFDCWPYDEKQKLVDGDKNEEFPKMKFKLADQVIVDDSSFYRIPFSL